MKRKINPFWLIYLILVLYPLLVIMTIITSVLMIILSFIGDYRWCYIPAKYWGRAICAISFVRVKVVGDENYEKNKSYIFIANHQSIYDIFVVYGWLINKFKWVMKNTLRKIPFVGLACHKAGHIFIDRSNPIRAKRSLDEAKKKLRNGSSIVIFAEGSRTKNGKLGKFKRGAFKIAEDLKLPIIPVSIKGTFDIMPVFSYYIKPGKITVTFHEAIDTQNLNEQTMEEIIETTRNVIQKGLQ
ncbi:acyl-phosphate glycerol 3-phosphate acyltransferase [Porphyromonadaceae bacterium COT-184 OH4590]|nr:acyl-phosphate glycerol 3-phosphate acyltransferase [Porphyromonadaceae bacterium COT-184 OH4590]MDO4726449.1 lysophospholipid acyltransferase family protein [Porphyromonadaceae bacterium]